MNDEATATDLRSIPPEDRVSRLLRLFLATSLAAITLSMTPFTYQMDDIKYTLFLFAGPILMLMGLWQIGTGRVKPPPRLMGALAIYLLVLVVSGLGSHYRWAARDQCASEFAGGVSPSAGGSLGGVTSAISQRA